MKHVPFFVVPFCLAMGTFTFNAHAAEKPVLMSDTWAQQACEAWNNDPVLTKDLAGGWIENDKERGYKIMQIYRSDCEDSPRIEMKIVSKDGKAMCSEGSWAKSALDDDADYLMWAETRRWKEMGAGDYGAMWAMTLGRLNFEGPYGEAMGNMGPFGNFLLLVGKVPASLESCPK